MLISTLLGNFLFKFTSSTYAFSFILLIILDLLNLKILECSWSPEILIILFSESFSFPVTVIVFILNKLELQIITVKTIIIMKIRIIFTNPNLLFLTLFLLSCFLFSNDLFNYFFFLLFSLA